MWCLRTHGEADNALITMVSAVPTLSRGDGVKPYVTLK